MKFIGIDPGKEGAIVVLDENNIIVEKTPIPLIGKEINIVGLKNILLKYSDSLLMGNEKVIVGVESTCYLWFFCFLYFYFWFWLWSYRRYFVYA